MVTPLIISFFFSQINQANQDRQNQSSRESSMIEAIKKQIISEDEQTSIIGLESLEMFPVNDQAHLNVVTSLIFSKLTFEAKGYEMQKKQASSNKKSPRDPARIETACIEALSRIHEKCSANTRFDLSNKSLMHIYLRGADLSRANFRAANLTEASLDKAHFNEANLSEAVLYGAGLRGADFNKANLHGADFKGAHLDGVKNLTQKQLDTAFCDKFTSLPIGLRCKKG